MDKIRRYRNSTEEDMLEVYIKMEDISSIWEWFKKAKGDVVYIHMKNGDVFSTEFYNPTFLTTYSEYDKALLNLYKKLTGRWEKK